MDRHTRQNSLKYRMFPEMVKSGMLVKDETGRYERYTVTETGFNWLAYSLFTDCKCNLSGVCHACEGTGKTSRANNEQQECWNCKGEGHCTDCEERLSYFSMQELLHLITPFIVNS